MLACWRESRLAEVYSKIPDQEKEIVEQTLAEAEERDTVSLMEESEKQVEHLSEIETLNRVQIIDENVTMKESNQSHMDFPIESVVQIRESNGTFEMISQPKKYQNKCCSVS